MDHDHVFGQDRVRPGERRTRIVIALTAVTMVVEVMAGMAYGSMALLADGLHMASHVAALTISAAAYLYARRRAGDPGFSFGTGKVNALGGYSGAMLLGGFAAVMAWESVRRLLAPVAIHFDQAILVAVAGLLVNGGSALVLGQDDAEGDGAAEHGHHDHNLRAAYLHVLADALTSVLAIAALLGGKYLGVMWMDPVMGVAGALLVAHWAWRLLGRTGGVLLDRQAPPHVREAVLKALQSGEDCRVTDLHVWSVGPGILAVEAALVTPHPEEPQRYKDLLTEVAGIVHATVEVRRERP